MIMFFLSKRTMGIANNKPITTILLNDSKTKIRFKIKKRLSLLYRKNNVIIPKTNGCWFVSKLEVSDFKKLKREKSIDKLEYNDKIKKLKMKINDTYLQLNLKSLLIIKGNEAIEIKKSWESPENPNIGKCKKPLIIIKRKEKLIEFLLKWNELKTNLFLNRDKITKMAGEYIKYLRNLNSLNSTAKPIFINIIIICIELILIIFYFIIFKLKLEIWLINLLKLYIFINVFR